MPYNRRRYSRKKTPYRSRNRSRTARRSVPWYNRKYSTYELATKAYKAGKYLATMINAEKKKFDFTSTVNQSTTESVHYLNALAQGDTDASRDGNSVLMNTVSIRGTVSYNSAGATAQRVRIVLLQDKQQISDTVPTYTSVFETSSVIAPLNSDFVGRYNILYDKVFSLNASFGFQRQFSFGKYLNQHARFNGPLSSDIQRNGLYLMVISDQATNGPEVDLYSRLNYYDN